jgi:hypothetical protein
VDREGRAHDGAETFFPRGAVASFLAMVAVYVVVWLLMYALMSGRG